MTPAKTALGIDIGGTWVRVGLVTARGELIAHLAAAAPPEGDPALLTDLLATQVRRVLEGTPGGAMAIGIALPGIWDRQTGIMERAVNLSRLEGRNIRQLFADALGRAVFVDTDVNAAAWAQWRALRPSPKRFVYLSIGTGVGGGVIVDGQVLRHTHGGPGHFGHLVVDTAPDAPLCRCGARGCLEAIVGGAAKPLRKPTAESATHALAIGIQQLAVLYAPDVIALGGGVIEHQSALIDQARLAWDQLHHGLAPPELSIERAPLPSDRAGVVGAGLLALQAPPSRTTQAPPY